MSTSLPEAEISGKLLQGTCGWSDQSLARCGRFYPASLKTSEARLTHYSRHFPCVEVDTSTYAIPAPTSTARWAAAVSKGFVFHFKAFGILCGQSQPTSSIPHPARALMADALQHADWRWTLLQLPQAVQDEIWRLWHASLQPVIQAGVMGVVLFQFQLGFTPTDSNRALLRHLRTCLQSDIQMAVEFRNRQWFTEHSEHRQSTLKLLREINACLVASDDLHHEVFQRDKQQQGLPPGKTKQLMPIALDITCPSFAYVRVHRRHGGFENRLLDAQEISAWAQRLRGYAVAPLQGPVYFLWGTDWEDAPMRNAKNLDAEVPPQMRFDWPAWLKRQPPKRGTLHAFFSSPPRKKNKAQQDSLPNKAQHDSPNKCHKQEED